MITNIRFELYGLIDTHGMVSVHGGELRLLSIESLTQKVHCHWFYVVFTKESCVPRLW
jgi:hypothetical protein